MKAASRNWRESVEDGIGPGWPHSAMWQAHKAQEWHAERLSLELIDMLRAVKGFDCRMVESMADAVSVSNGHLTLVVVIANEKRRPRATKRKREAFRNDSHPRTIPEQGGK